MSKEYNDINKRLECAQNEINDIYSILAQFTNRKIELIASGKSVPFELMIDGVSTKDTKKMLLQRIRTLEDELFHLKERIENNVNYIQKLEHSIEEARQGRVVVKSLEELEAME